MHACLHHALMHEIAYILTVPVLHGIAPQGLISAAVYVEQSTRAALYAAAEAYPDYPILMTGHSLGAGVAALMTLMTRHGHGVGARAAPFAARTYCVGVACPPVVSMHVADACNGYIISLVRGTAWWRLNNE